MPASPRDDLTPFLPLLGEARAILVRPGTGRAEDSRIPGLRGSPSLDPPGTPRYSQGDMDHGSTLFGVDTISISSPPHREEGRACHRAFLCGLPPILILEDLDLSDPRLTGDGFQLPCLPLVPRGPGRGPRGGNSRGRPGEDCKLIPSRKPMVFSHLFAPSGRNPIYRKP